MYIQKSKDPIICLQSKGVVTGERDEKLEYALKEVADKVSAKIYKVSFRLEDY